jgi:hypothetical protein
MENTASIEDKQAQEKATSAGPGITKPTVKGGNESSGKEKIGQLAAQQAKAPAVPRNLRNADSRKAGSRF